jgi:glycerophosphoryl diester phosphodiesterase
MVRIFAHRGHAVKGGSENSLVSLKDAYQAGFRAVEFDIWFLNKELVLNHDEPSAEEIKSLAKFHEFLCFGNEIDYWLDFKNLDEGNVEEVILLVKLELEKVKIDLGRVFFAPFITDYKLAKIIVKKIREVFEADGSKVQITAVCETVDKIDELEVFLKESEIKFLSIFHQLVNQNLTSRLNGVTLFAWTVNDSEAIQNLHKIGVNNFASDLIKPYTK